MSLTRISGSSDRIVLIIAPPRFLWLPTFGKISNQSDENSKIYREKMVLKTVVNAYLGVTFCEISRQLYLTSEKW
jgi:hypothetical protein